MSEEENKAISNRFAQALSEGDLDALDETMAPHLATEFKEVVAEFRTAFPDLRVTHEDQIAEGDKVANRWVDRGTHRGEFMGVAPTGKQVEFRGIRIDRITEGKIEEVWLAWDELGLMRQLGAIPEPRQSEEASPT